MCRGSLTWDFINFIQEFALDFLKHVILVDLCVVGAGGVRHRGDYRRRGGRGDSGGAGGLHGCHSRCVSEQVELHCQRLGVASLRHISDTEVGMRHTEQLKARRRRNSASDHVVATT